MGPQDGGPGGRIDERKREYVLNAQCFELQDHGGEVRSQNLGRGSRGKVAVKGVLRIEPKSDPGGLTAGTTGPLAGLIIITTTIII